MKVGKLRTNVKNNWGCLLEGKLEGSVIVPVISLFSVICKIQHLRPADNREIRNSIRISSPSTSVSPTFHPDLSLLTLQITDPGSSKVFEAGLTKKTRSYRRPDIPPG